jgi:hypothetical protein
MRQESLSWPAAGGPYQQAIRQGSEMKKVTQHMVVELDGMVQLLSEEEWRELASAERAARKVIASGLPENEARRLWLSLVGPGQAVVRRVELDGHSARE